MNGGSARSVMHSNDDVCKAHSVDVRFVIREVKCT